MLTFTLAISCLTTSNVPWFMDLTFQVPMQYCSLQHLILLLSPVTSTTGYCFCFGSIPSFFLELFLHWYPVAYWVLTDLGSSPFSILSFCLLILKGELPRSVGTQYATGYQWRNNSRKNEETEPKLKQHPVLGVTGDRSKVWCCKKQYCIGTLVHESRQIGSGQTGDGKSEHRHFRNQRTKMDWNGLT